MPGMKRLPFDLHTALAAWQWGPFSICVLVGVVLAGYLYLRGDWKLAARGRRWRGRRTVAFLLGLASVDVALQSSVATFTNWYFPAHIVQHLLLMTVAPPLMAMGAPSTMLLQAGPNWAKKAWRSVLHSRPFAWVTHPVPVWFGYFGAMFAFFLTPLINFAMEHMALMDAFNLFFLLGGCMYWWPIVEVDPIVHWRMGYGAKILNLSLGVPFESFLGIVIMMEKHPEASMYTLSSSHWGGGLLWAATELSTLMGLVPVMLMWVRSDERAAARADARARAVLERSVPLTTAPAAPGAAGLLAGASDSRRRPAPGASDLLAGPPRRPAPALIGERFRPLLQPGNSTWEAMWKAKAGRVPATRRTPQTKQDG
jgi:putative membrane protein